VSGKRSEVAAGVDVLGHPAGKQDDQLATQARQRRNRDRIVKGTKARIVIV